MSGYQLTQGEWNIFVSNLADDALPNKRLYADAPMMFGALRQDAADVIGEDVKLMIKDRSVIHGTRNRRSSDGSQEDVNLSLKEMQKIPQIASNPDAIYKDNTSGNFVFQNSQNKEDIWMIFLPGRDTTSMVLHTFFKASKGILESDKRYSLLWKK